MMVVTSLVTRNSFITTCRVVNMRIIYTYTWCTPTHETHALRFSQKHIYTLFFKMGTFCYIYKYNRALRSHQNIFVCLFRDSSNRKLLENVRDFSLEPCLYYHRYYSQQTMVLRRWRRSSYKHMFKYSCYFHVKLCQLKYAICAFINTFKLYSKDWDNY